MGSGAMIQNFIKIGSSIENVKGGDSHSDIMEIA
jgi:hypothetical protein